MPFHHLRNFSPDLQDILKRLLEKDPAYRIRFDELIAHPFLACEGYEYELE